MGAHSAHEAYVLIQVTTVLAEYFAAVGTSQCTNDFGSIGPLPPVSDINAEAVGGAVRLAGPEIVSPELVDVDSNLRNSTMSQPYTRGLEAMADS